MNFDGTLLERWSLKQTNIWLYRDLFASGWMVGGGPRRGLTTLLKKWSCELKEVLPILTVGAPPAISHASLQATSIVLSQSVWILLGDQWLIVIDCRLN